MTELKKRDENSRSKIALYVLIVVGAATILSWSWYFLTMHKTVGNFEKKLAKTTVQRSDEIRHYIQEQIEHGYTRAQQPELIASIEKLGSLTENELNDPSLDTYKTKLTLFLEEYSTEQSYRNSILITKAGSVVYSDYAQGYVGQNLIQTHHQNSVLGESFQRVIMSLTEDVSDFSYDPILKRTVLFVSIPIFKQGKLLGVLAQEVNTAKIYNIVQNYIGLGKSGDILLGKRVPDGILYISKSRNADIKPFKNYLYFNRLKEVIVSVPIAYAATGHKGQGKYLDQMQKKAIGAWQFVPVVNWGIVAKIDLFEVKNSLYYWCIINICLLVLLLLLLLCIAYGLELIEYSIKRIEYWYADPKKRWITKLTILCIALLICVATFAHYYCESGKELDAENKRSSMTIENAKQHLTHLLKEYERTGKSLAFDLDTGRLKKDELIARLQRDLQEKPGLYGITIAYSPYKYNKNRRLYAPYVYRKDSAYEVDYLDESFDYTKSGIQSVQMGGAWQWYQEPIKAKKLVWFDPYKDPLTSLLLAGYSLPFYDPRDAKKTEPVGVINVVFDTAPIYNLMARLDVDTKGVTYLLSRSGAFIYYPIQDYIARQKTIFDVAREHGNEELIKIAKNALQGKVGQNCFYDHETGEKNYTEFTLEPITRWAIGIILPSHEVQLSPIQLRKHYIQIILTLLFLFCIMLWVFGGYLFSRLHSYSFVACALILLAIGTLFYAIENTHSFEQMGADVITNSVQLNQFLYELDNYAAQVNEKPSLKIPFGIYVYSANQTNYSTISISAYVWLKFPKDIDEELVRPPQLPQTVERETHPLKIYDVIEGDKRIVGWFLNANLTQSFNYSKYPLDIINVRIDAEYPDLSKNFTLVPSIEDYRNIDPESLPGIGSYRELVFSEFTKKRTYFTLETEIEDCSLGLQSYSDITKHVYTAFNISIARHLLYDFITLFLPMLIIFFSIFTIFSMSQRDIKIEPLTALSAYTGLVFTAIILHGTFRSRQATSQLLYIEYVFFLLYITFVVLVLHALLKMHGAHINRYVARFFELLRIFFWPVQLFLFMIITMMVFYAS